jgi:DNA-binding CsgD family transcriptional regulator
MTQILLIQENEALRVIDNPARPEDIVRKINAGDWQTFLGYDLARANAWQALRIGKFVIVHAPTPDEEKPRISLTAKDIQSLQSLCSGFNLTQTAYYLRVAPKTLQNRINRMRLKFNAQTREELLAKATALGYVQPDLDNIFD